MRTIDQHPADPASEAITPPTVVGAIPRLAWGVVAVLAVFGMLGSIVLTLWAAADGGGPGGIGSAIVRYFSYFTILTNLLVAIVAVPFALGRSPGPVLRVLTLNAVTGIVITGVVHWFLLRPISEVVPGVPTLMDNVQHVIVPVLTPIVWLAIGPRGHVRATALAGSVVFPLLYLAWTLIHGAATAWYPYPFIDVTAIGYASALRTGGIILVIMCLLAVGCWAFDRALTRRSRASQAARTGIAGGLTR